MDTGSEYGFGHLTPGKYLIRVGKSPARAWYDCYDPYLQEHDLPKHGCSSPYCGMTQTSLMAESSLLQKQAPIKHTKSNMSLLLFYHYSLVTCHETLDWFHIGWMAIQKHCPYYYCIGATYIDRFSRSFLRNLAQRKYWWAYQRNGQTSPEQSLSFESTPECNPLVWNGQTSPEQSLSFESGNGPIHTYIIEFPRTQPSSLEQTNQSRPISIFRIRF